MQVTTEKYNPLPMLWKPPPPSPSSILDKLLEAIYKIFIDPVATTRDSIDILRRDNARWRELKPLRGAANVYLRGPSLFEEGLVG